MKIHEHQGKELFKNEGVPVPNGYVAFNVNDAVYLWQQNRKSLGNSFILESQQNTPYAILTQAVAQPIVFGTN